MAPFLAARDAPAHVGSGQLDCRAGAAARHRVCDYATCLTCPRHLDLTPGPHRLANADDLAGARLQALSIIFVRSFSACVVARKRIRRPPAARLTHRPSLPQLAEEIVEHFEITVGVLGRRLDACRRAGRVNRLPDPAVSKLPRASAALDGRLGPCV